MALSKETTTRGGRYESSFRIHVFATKGLAEVDVEDSLEVQEIIDITDSVFRVPMTLRTT